MRAMMATINEALQNDAISVATAQLFPLTGVRYEHMSSIKMFLSSAMRQNHGWTSITARCGQF